MNSKKCFFFIIEKKTSFRWIWPTLYLSVLHFKLWRYSLQLQCVCIYRSNFRIPGNILLTYVLRIFYHSRGHHYFVQRGWGLNDMRLNNNDSTDVVKPIRCSKKAYFAVTGNILWHRFVTSKVSNCTEYLRSWHYMYKRTRKDFSNSQSWQRHDKISCQ